MKKTMLILSVLMYSVAAVAETETKAPTAGEKPANPMVKIKTTKGDIVVELYADKAPITVKNFMTYTREGLYNGKIFHRVMKGFMIQCGGITTDMVNKATKKPIKNESYNKLRNKRGTLAMARKGEADSATNQFFINHVDNRSLDFDGPYKPGYAVFGKVVKGIEVVDAIAQVKTKNSQYYDEKYKVNVPCKNVPVEPIVIESVTIVGDTCDKGKSCDKDCDKCPNKNICEKKCPKKNGSETGEKCGEKTANSETCSKEKDNGCKKDGGSSKCETKEKDEKSLK